ncbi:MAG TPA: GPW/gp25 family protein [Waterburya sp.]|jgi:hypothetical protein
MQIGYPFHIDKRGRVADATYQEHIRHLIEQVLFTSPGERVNRPDFGTNLKQLIFNPNNEELAAAAQFMVQGALQQWLGDMIEVEALAIENQQACLAITVQYRVIGNPEPQVVQVSREA